MTLSVSVARTAPRAFPSVGVPVYTEGPVPRTLGLNRASLAALGFDAKPGQTLVVPSTAGSPTLLVAVGMGEPGKVTAATIRTAGAALARAVQKQTAVATALADVPSVAPELAAQALVEGMALASYRFVELKKDKSVPALASLVLLSDTAKAKKFAAGADRGLAVAGAVCLARDLGNRPPAHLTAPGFAALAEELGRAAGLEVEVWDEHRLAAERCAGLLAVNAGSANPARLVKLTYAPRNPTATLALVGKGITFDSGGLSLKPSDAMIRMKMDMMGAGAVFAAMTALKAVKPRVKVVAWLCLTDNMPSGTALKVSDVITYRDGTTVEVHNTDAEGRLVLADALILAAEEKVDAIIDAATLTGACMAALGLKYAGLMGNHDGLVAQVQAAAKRADEKVWHMPLPEEYRKLLDSEVADMKNIGGPYAGMLTAGLFLQEFVGGLPWAHLDIAGKEAVDADDGWNVRGATGFGVRTFLELVESFERPAAG